jgi:serine palmitoyltransferase
MTTFFGYGVLVAFGHLRDFFGQFSGQSRYLATIPPKGYAPLLASWENFYTRRLYHRIQDCWNRPVCSSPGAKIDIVCRASKDGNKTLCPDGNVDEGFLNLGSYNYLGFADDWVNTCSKDVVGSLDEYNVTCSSAPMDLGTTKLHRELEKVTADFVGKPASIVFNMGYGTNSSTIPTLVGKGGLIISDSLNHTSIVSGARASGAKIMTFKHNDVAHLEQVIKTAIVQGQPRTHRPWTKILVMVEGIYSMEGEICNLRGVIDVCKKYKAYSYVDEAHSIGALGRTGRGICEYSGVDPSEVDILMGTFTKSFGAMGGYIASSKEFVEHVRMHSSGSVYANSMSPTVCQQILTSLKIISGADGTNLGETKLNDIRNNANFFRQSLIDLGLEVYGDFDSPIIPVMLYNPTKIAAFSRECYKRKLAVVVVGFPATPLVLSRARFCISAGHKRADLEEALVKIEEVADVLKLRYRSSVMG